MTKIIWSLVYHQTLSLIRLLSKWAVMEIDLLDNAYTNRDYLKSKSLDVCNASSFETKQQKGFHEEHFSCSWSSENSPQGGGKCNRWNIDLWKSTGKVSMSKMLWWKFYTFAVTCSTLSLVLLITPILRFVMVIPPKYQHPFTFLSAKDILWHN